MAKYLSNRQKNLRIGISSYTESNTVLEITGKVGIGTTNAQQSLYVVGNGYFSGDLRVAGIATFGNNTVIIDGDNNIVKVGTAITLSSVDGITTPQLNISGTLTAQNINVSGASTLASNGGITTSGGDLYGNRDVYVGRNLIVSGITTTNSLNIGATQVISSARQLQNIVSLDATTTATIESAITNAPNNFTSLNVTGISTLGVTSTTNLTAQQLNVSGVSTFQSDIFFGDNDIAYFGNGNDLLIYHSGLNSYVRESGTGRLLLASDGPSVDIVKGTDTETLAKFNIDGSVELYYNNTKEFETTGYGATVFGILESQGLQVSGASTFSGITTHTTPLFGTQASFSGVVTASSFSGNASSATQLQTARSISITGDVAGSVFFDGTQNVSIASTIQPNSVALGSDTTGDYVQTVSGTVGQITVTGGTGESSTPVVAITNNPTLPGNVTIANDLQVNNNLNVTGNITIGGTSAYIIANDFRVKDADIVLGFTTNISNQDVSNDTTANHGGIAIASTEGSPLVQLFIAGIETTPTTYKKIMWFKAGSFAGLGTDAWLSNYAVGIGSTQFPVGTRLAAGAVQFTERDLAVVRNINASGIVTANTFSGNLANTLTLNTSGTGLSGSTTFNNSGAATFTVTSNATSANTGGAIVSRDALGGFSAGVVTATTFSGSLANTLTLNTSGTGLSGSTTFNNSGAATFTVTSNATSDNTSSAIVSRDALGGFVAGIITATSFVGGISSFTSLNVSGISTVGVLSAISVNATGIITASSFRPSSGYIQAADGTNSFYIYNTNGNVAFQGTIGASQINSGQGYAAINFTSTATPTVLVRNNLGVSGIATIFGNVGLGTTNPTSRLDVSGDGRFTGVVTATTFNGQINAGVSTLGISTATNLTAQQLNVSGIATVNSLNIGAIQVISSGRQLQNIASLDAVTTATIESAISNAPNDFTSLNVSGISTLGVTSATNLTAQQLNVSGLSTFSGITTHTTSLFGTQASFTGVVTANTFSGNLANTLTLNTSGIGLSGSTTFNNSGAATFTVTSNATSDNTNSTIVSRNSLGGFSAGVVTATTFNGQINAGVSTLGIATATNLTAQQLNVTGLSTFGNTVNVGSNIITNTLSSSGVGIGSYLRLKATTWNGEGGEVAFEYTNGNTGYFLDVNAGNVFRFANYDTAGVFTFLTNSTEKLRITNAGLVGIGSASPTTTLDVIGTVKAGTALTSVQFGGDNGRNIEIGIGATNISTFLDFHGADSTYSDYATRLIRDGGDNGNFNIINRGTGSLRLVTQDAGVIDILTKNTFRHRIDSNGVILVGTANSTGTASQLFQVNSGGYFNGNLGVGNTNPTSTLMVQGDGRFVSSGQGDVSITHSSLVSTIRAAASVQLALGAGGAEAVRINTSGNVGINSTAPTSRLDVVGDAKVSGVVTATTFNGQVNAGVGTITILSGTTATYTTGNITNISGTNLNYTGISTITNLSVTNINSTGIITATQFTTGSGNLGFTTNTISGPSEIIIDPAPVGVGTTSGVVRIRGDLYVDGTQFIVNSTTIELADFNVGIATTVGTNALLDGAGIGIGSTNIRKTITWNNGLSALSSSENWNIFAGKTYKIGGTDVLSSTTLGTNIVNSSLTSVGTLGQLNVSGVTTSSGGFVGNLTGTATTATNLADAANITTGTIAVARLSGTYNININGSATYATTAGIATYATSAGIATYASSSGIATYATSAGIATYATTAGVSTSVIGGIASVTQLNVSGISTLGITTFTGAVSFGTSAYFGDNKNLILGDGNDLLIYHDGSQSTILDQGTGQLRIGAENTFYVGNSTFTEAYIRAFYNGQVELYYDNSKEFETTGYGATVYGTLQTQQLNVSGITTSSTYDTVSTRTGSATATTTTTSQTAIHTGLPSAFYRSVEYLVQAVQSTNFHTTKILVVHDGTTAYLTEYGTVFNNATVASYDVDISGGNLRLLATPASSSSTTFKINFTTIVV